MSPAVGLAEPSSLADFAIIPPDGGWGWVVVFAAFYCQIIIDGIQLTFGMILKELSDAYDVDISQIALIGSIIYGMHYLCGPICSGLSYLWSDRVVCIVGAVMASICITSAYLQPPLPVLYVITGCLGGLGLGFVNMTSILVTTVYFTERRLIAIGLVVCGTGVGTMVFAAATTFVLHQLNDWRYVCLLEGILALTMALAAASFRPLRPTRIHADHRLTVGTAVLDEETDDEESSDDVSSMDRQYRLFYLSKLDQIGPDEQHTPPSVFIKHTKKALEDIATHTAAHNINYCSCPALLQLSCCSQRRRHHRILAVNPNMSTSLLMGDPTSGIRQISPEGDTRNRFRWLSAFSTILDCKILKSLPFFAYCIAVSLSASALIIVLFYEKVRFLTDEKTGNEVTYYMIWIGFCNMAWRLILGYASTLHRVNYHALNIVGLILGGLATMLSAVSDSTTWMYITAALYGLAIACFAVFYPVICAELVGRNKLTNATGVAMMFMGIFSIIGAPISGLVYEVMDDIRVIFYIAGSMFLVSGVIFIFITGKPMRNPHPAPH